MPNLNPDRRVEHERYVAQRIRDLRQAEGWSLENVAQKMSDAGCPLDRSAVHRIEQGKPPRRITVDELVTFSNIFGVSLRDLVTPPNIARSKEASRLWNRYKSLQPEVERKTAELNGIVNQLIHATAGAGDEELLRTLLEQAADERGLVPGFGRTPDEVVDVAVFMARDWPRPAGEVD